MPKVGEPSGLDALATAAVLGDNISGIAECWVGATTRNPRHRPGCTCIVCIQPPSGKGKHDPTCKCNVCLTVRRRFESLSMRKKKRQLDREAEVAQARDRAPVKLEPAREDISGDTKANTAGMEADMEEASKGQLDLNCDPHREDEVLAQTAGMSLTTLMNAVDVPSDMYLEPTGSQKQENITFVSADTEGTQQQ